VQDDPNADSVKREGVDKDRHRSKKRKSSRNFEQWIELGSVRLASSALQAAYGQCMPASHSQ
jgi:hypothetical protein